MITALTILHIFLSFFMIAVVLLQQGKGASIGAAFGGSSQTLFGARGATTFLAKMTVVFAALFMVTSLSLAYMASKRGVSSVVLDEARGGGPASVTAPVEKKEGAASGDAQSPATKTQGAAVPGTKTPAGGETAR
jgi:preprotein translocase subunit SecG